MHEFSGGNATGAVDEDGYLLLFLASTGGNLEQSGYEPVHIIDRGVLRDEIDNCEHCLDGFFVLLLIEVDDPLGHILFYAAEFRITESLGVEDLSEYPVTSLECAIFTFVVGTLDGRDTVRNTATPLLDTSVRGKLRQVRKVDVLGHLVQKAHNYDNELGSLKVSCNRSRIVF